MHSGIVSAIFVTLCGAYAASGCDIIVHLKSDTSKTFQAQITAPNGKKSEKWTYTQPREKNTFQQKAEECSLKDWEISVFQDNKVVNTAKVTLNGIGRVTYKVGDDLKPVQYERQGATCSGQCAPLATGRTATSKTTSTATTSRH